MKLELPTVYVKDTGTAKGRGVFAARSHAAGETIENCPVILFEGSFGDVPQEVRRVLFNWRFLAKADTSHCLALGYGSLYNHGNPANMRYEADPGARVLRFVAARAIEADEELTINYNAVGGGTDSASDTWFGPMGVTPVKPGDRGV